MAVVGRRACPRCRSFGGDTTGDNLVVYSDGGARCFTCKYTILSCAERVKRGLPVSEEQLKIAEITEDDIEESKREGVSSDFTRKLKASTTYKGRRYRGISDITYKKYWVRNEYGEDGMLTRQFYPIFKEIDGVPILSRFKCRTHPKEFNSIGKNSKHELLYGERSFLNTKTEFCVITAGEIDAMSAHTMLYEEFGDIPCVCAVNGESATLQSMLRRVAFLNKFKYVFVIQDEDKAGDIAREDVRTNGELNSMLKAKMIFPKLSEHIDTDGEIMDINRILTTGRKQSFVEYFKSALSKK